MNTPVRKSESMPATSDFDHNNSSYNLLGDLKLDMLMYAPMLLINSRFIEYLAIYSFQSQASGESMFCGFPTSIHTQYLV